MDEVVLKFV
jgi:hypothetical protein